MEDVIIKIEMDSVQWNSLIMPILSINNEVRLNFSEEGLKYAVVNRENIALIHADIKERVFESYYYRHNKPGFEIAFDLDQVSDLKVKKEIITFEVLETVKHGEYQYRITLGSHIRFITPNPIDTLRKTPIIPNFEESTTNEYITVGKTFLDIVTKLKKIGENIDIREKDHDLIISSKNAITKHEYTLNAFETRNEDKYCMAMYTGKYIESILKTIKDLEITIKIGTDTPIIIDYTFEGDSYVSFMIAPRIEN